MPRRASLGTWLYFSRTALVLVFMSLRASTGRRARPSRPPRSAPAPHPGDAVLTTVPSHARLADSLTPLSPPASHLRPPPPPLPRSPPAPRGKRHATPAHSSMVARLVASSKPIAAGGAGAEAAAAAVGTATDTPTASSPPPLQPHGPSTPPQPPDCTPLAGLLPPRSFARSAARHPARPVPSPPHHHLPLTGHTHGAALSPSPARAQHHAGSCVTPRAITRFSHCAQRSGHIARVSAVPDLGPLLRVYYFEEQKRRPEHLRGRFHKLRPQVLTRRGHMQHASSFPSFTWMDLTNAQRTAMLPKHMQRCVAEGRFQPCRTHRTAMSARAVRGLSAATPLFRKYSRNVH